MHNYDAWLTTNREQERADEDWEAYSNKYDTPGNRETLKVALIGAIASSYDSAGNAPGDWTKQFTTIVERIIKRGIEGEDGDGLDRLYAAYSIAPNFDTFVDDRNNDYPDIPDYDDNDERYDQERDNG